MKRYCFDTSGITNPLESMPDDIHESLWFKVIDLIEAGEIAVTTEIYDEMYGSIRGLVGKCIDTHKADLLLEIGDTSWDFPLYITNVAAMQIRQHDFISEYNRNSPRTVGLNDLSIIALAQTLGLPVVSMEKSTSVNSIGKRRIPDVCVVENVAHLSFSEFLRDAGIKL